MRPSGSSGVAAKQRLIRLDRHSNMSEYFHMRLSGIPMNSSFVSQFDELEEKLRPATHPDEEQQQAFRKSKDEQLPIIGFVREECFFFFWRQRKKKVQKLRVEKLQNKKFTQKTQNKKLALFNLRKMI